MNEPSRKATFFSRVCVRCDAHFETKFPATKFCTPECAQTELEDRAGLRRAQRTPEQCESDRAARRVRWLRQRAAIEARRKELGLPYNAQLIEEHGIIQNRS